MEEKLISIKNAALPLILDATSAKELEEIKLQFLGRSGILTTALKELATVPAEKRPEIGRVANEIKLTIENALESTSESFKQSKRNNKKKFDVTEPGIKPPLGNIHLVTQAIEEITAIFNSIGFTRVRYPEVEWDWYAFEALNFPENHPARDDWETFFIKENPDPKKGPMILTPHTSSGQIREMITWDPSDGPIKMLNIAKCYRRQSDVSHSAMFHQFETLCVGENVSIADLKGVLDYFAKSYFGEKRKTRIRPYHFQFTEPSFEVDISCGICNGKAVLENGEPCKLCKAGWLELGGAGMVHPNVLRHCGIDPEKYTGFASGFGVERVLMMKDGIELDDLRLIYSPKLEFLQQF